MIVRNKPLKDYTVMRNQPLQSKELSLKAKGLWAFLMTKPDGWQVSVRGLATQLKEGKEAIMAALQELEGAGLYRKIRSQNAAGHFEYEDFVYDKPCTENPDTDYPDTENQPQVNTELATTDKVKTDKALSKEIDQKALYLTRMMAELVKSNYNFVTLDEKTLVAWYRDIEKIHRIDGHDWETIGAVINWSQADDFWKQNIRSGAKLRKQFENLLVRMKSQKQRVAVIS